ncbi:hypothetical protein C8R48DRAFT_194013 [Suillus tomentosus]|nr:hypothetical protein C8R48DRAFT_194013 [Suillus tomentosus]
MNIQHSIFNIQRSTIMSGSQSSSAGSVAQSSALIINTVCVEIMNAMRQEIRDEVIEQLNAFRIQLAKEIREPQESDAKLSASMAATQQRHATALQDLHRRMVLDYARDLLGARYGYTIDELRPWYQEVVDGRPARTLQQLVQEVRLKLDEHDARLLSDDALTMIFDRSRGTFHSEGNTAPHSASAEDLSLAITRPDLTALQAIYKFAHHEIPQL